MKYSKHICTIFNLQKTLLSLTSLQNNKPFEGYKRVYHLHLMKTGGTSLNNMFLNLSIHKNKVDLYNKLMKEKDLRIINNNWVFSAWNQLTISTGLYHYAWSHRPIYKTIIPSNTFIITCIRHPYNRIFSRYKHLIKDFNNGKPLRPNFEYKYLGNSFEEYLLNIPQKELCHQLYMFSKELNVDKAINRISKVNYIMSLNDFTTDIQNINNILKIKLVPIHKRKNTTILEPDFGEIFRIVDKSIQPELDFYYKALEIKKNQNTYSYE